MGTAAGKITWADGRPLPIWALRTFMRLVSGVRCLGWATPNETFTSGNPFLLSIWSTTGRIVTSLASNAPTADNVAIQLLPEGSTTPVWTDPAYQFIGSGERWFLGFDIPAAYVGQAMRWRVLPDIGLTISGVGVWEVPGVWPIDVGAGSRAAASGSLEYRMKWNAVDQSGANHAPARDWANPGTY